MEKLKAKLDSLKSSKQEMEETMQSEITKLQKDVKLKEEEMNKEVDEDGVVRDMLTKSGPDENETR